MPLYRVSANENNFFAYEGEEHKSDGLIVILGAGYVSVENNTGYSIE